MIASMTGYAALTGDLPQGALQLEIKSVNSRFLDIQFRIGEELRSLEPALRELIAAQVTRGKVDCRLGFTPRLQAGASLALDRDLLLRVAALAREAAGVADPPGAPLHCFAYAARLLSAAGLYRPRRLRRPAWPGFSGVCREVCSLPGAVLDGVRTYGAPEKVEYDVGRDILL